MVETTLLDPFKRAVHCSAAGAWFDTAPWLDQPPLFWREALRRLCHAMGTGMVKEKAVLELLTRLRRGARDGWIPLKRDNKSYICGTRVVRPHPPRAASFDNGVYLLTLSASGHLLVGHLPA